MLPEVAQAEIRGQRSRHESSGHVRDEYLSAVSGGTDASRPMDVEPHVVIAAEHRLAAVQAHPHANSSRVGRPRFGGKCAVGSGGRLHGGERTPEDDEERVALRRDFDAPRLVEGRAEQRLVPLQDRRVCGAQGLHQARRPFDVGEQEGQRAGGQHADRSGPRSRHERRIRFRSVGRYRSYRPAQIMSLAASQGRSRCLAWVSRRRCATAPAGTGPRSTSRGRPCRSSRSPSSRRTPGRPARRRSWRRLAG